MKQIVYIELDALLDTRLATVSRLNEQAAIDLLLSDEYFNRPSDEMGKLTPLITTEQYREAYQNRDILTLMAARPTDLYPALQSILTGLEIKRIQLAVIESTAIEINICPYDLTPEEQEIIVESVVSLGEFTTAVSCVNVPMCEMSLDEIKRRGWTSLIMYNFIEWLELTFNKPDFDPNKTPRLTGVPFYIPGLVKDSSVDIPEEERKLPSGRIMNKYEGMKMALMPFFNVEYLSTPTLSIFMPPEDKEP